ncbi:MAG: DUF1190 domain-containing protein [Methylocystis sp.]|nr:DUF1190 domain-containing protein [Methylocystis sp.]
MRCRFWSSVLTRRLVHALPAEWASTALRRLFLLAALVASPALAESIPAAPMGKSYFFATREACRASGVFSRRDCAAAFVNAYAEWRDRAPRFSSGVECRLRFALCEFQRGEAGYMPVALGVEMAPTRRGVLAAPTLAVETPERLFPKLPVSRDYDAQRDLAVNDDADARRAENSDILPADRFEPFSKRPHIRASLSFSYASLGAIDDDTPRRAAEETPAQRRARLRAAPFIY